MNKHQIMNALSGNVEVFTSVEHLARPLNSACYQAFLIMEDIPTHSLWVVYQSGKQMIQDGVQKSYYAMSDKGLIRVLAQQVDVREEFLEQYGTDFVFDTENGYFASRLVGVLHILRVKGIQFMLLRSSEVSLDRVVQLQD